MSMRFDKEQNLRRAIRNGDYEFAREIMESLSSWERDYDDIREVFEEEARWRCRMDNQTIQFHDLTVRNRFGRAQVEEE